MAENSHYFEYSAFLANITAIIDASLYRYPQVGAHSLFHVMVGFLTPGTVIVRVNNTTYGVPNVRRSNQLASHLPICEQLGCFVGPFDGGAMIRFEQSDVGGLLFLEATFVLHRAPRKPRLN